MHDLVIRGAMVADGVGNPLIRTDVAVNGEHIAEVGDVTESARQTVDADGLVLAPGIVDVHTHYDAQLTWESRATPSPALGVTTVVMGNCGFSIAPCPPERREQMARNLAEVEGMSIAALEAGIDWSFEDFPEYLALLRRKGCYPNAGVFVGHSAVRTAVLGAEASERAATGDEIATMRGIVTEAMEAGAIGFATSTSINHNGDGGVPMPSRLAEDDEMRALVGVLGELGRGIFQLTVGPGMTVERLEGLAAETGRPVFMTAALHNETFPDRAIGMLEDAAAAQSRGNAVWAQVSCQPLSMDFSMRTAFPLQSLDAWEPLHGASDDEFLSIIASRDFRDRFRDDLEKPQRGRIFYGDWRRVAVAMAATPAHRPLEGETIEAIAGREGRDPVDVMFDLAVDEKLGTTFNAALLNADETAVEGLLRHDAGLISLSDAGAHLCYLCDAGYGLHLLGHWVRDKGVFDLADGIRRITSLPAQLYGIPDRGEIAPGMFADLLLFDPATVGRGAIRRVDDLPGGESRLVRDASGVHGVWVNGTGVYDGDGYRDVPPPGHVLDRFLS
jgi:N-acyl-D-aspartate/D-glutamate deacylase